MNMATMVCRYAHSAHATRTVHTVWIRSMFSLACLSYPMMLAWSPGFGRYTVMFRDFYIDACPCCAYPHSTTLSSSLDSVWRAWPDVSLFSTMCIHQSFIKLSADCTLDRRGRG